MHRETSAASTRHTRPRSRTTEIRTGCGARVRQDGRASTGGKLYGGGGVGGRGVAGEGLARRGSFVRSFVRRRRRIDSGATVVRERSAVVATAAVVVIVVVVDAVVVIAVAVVVAVVLPVECRSRARVECRAGAECGAESAECELRAWYRGTCVVGGSCVPCPSRSRRGSRDPVRRPSPLVPGGRGRAARVAARGNATSYAGLARAFAGYVSRRGCGGEYAEREAAGPVGW